MTPVEVYQGTGPIVLGLPHTGTYVPDAIADRLNENGRLLADTDWHIDQLYAGLLPQVTTVRAVFHRYVIDANRDPEGQSLYPGQNTTTLVPLTDFDGHPIWSTPPDAADVAARRAAFHAPYHAALSAELARVRDLHGVAILYDCHSIRSRIPFLFDGTLPDFNIGTNMTTTCAPQIEAATARICAQADGYSHVINGRFKGGWTTRH
jgi:formiminoglutamase